jgi:hypothetical protein
MLTPDQLFAFLLAAIAITATPGPDNLMVLGISVAKGPLPPGGWTAWRARCLWRWAHGWRPSAEHWAGIFYEKYASSALPN